VSATRPGSLRTASSVPATYGSWSPHIVPIPGPMPERDPADHDVEPPVLEVDAEYLLETFLENTPDHMYMKDADGRFTRLSASLARWMGADDARQVLGRTDLDFFAPAHADPARAAELEIMRTGEPIVGLEEREIWRDGRVTWVSTTKVPLRTRDNRLIGIFGLSRDITERKLADELAQQQARQLEQLALQLEQLTLQDDLTGLYNRRGLDLLGGSAVDRAARDGTPLCVMFMDLDGLKAINDGFGHADGDAALVTTAGLLRDAVRLTDAVGRIGGDEFAAVLVGVTAGEAQNLCDRVRGAARQRPPGERSLSVSIGIAALVAGELDTLDELIAAADRAMYEGRRQRRRKPPLAIRAEELTDIADQ
jgi:diguanylate cyclase (GGDEF)-like protein/PAS domain S-box-containing protein